MEEEQESSGRESEEGPLIYPDFEYEVTFYLFRFRTCEMNFQETWTLTQKLKHSYKKTKNDIIFIEFSTKTFARQDI